MTDQAEPGSSIGDDSEPFSVRSDRLLIVEGDFDRGFLRELLDRNQRTGVDIDILHGKDKYAARVLTRVLTDKQDRLRWLGLARDADTNAENTFASMVGAMQRVRDVKPWFPIPPRPWERIAGEENRTATIFVFPPDESTGDIERWIWGALREQPESACIDRYVDCLTSIGRDLPRPWKTRVNAYLAALAHPDMPLRAAARAAELPVGSPVFASFIDLIPPDHERS